MVTLCVDGSVRSQILVQHCKLLIRGIDCETDGKNVVYVLVKEGVLQQCDSRWSAIYPKFKKHKNMIG